MLSHTDPVQPNDDPILDAARDLSERDPSWTMTSLAREARVSRAMLYRRFGSREGCSPRTRRPGPRGLCSAS